MTNNQAKHHNKLLRHLSNNLICPKCNKKANRVFYTKSDLLKFLRKKFYICKCQELSFYAYKNQNSFIIDLYENSFYIHYHTKYNSYYIRNYLDDKYKDSSFDLIIKKIYTSYYYINFNLISNFLNKSINILYKLENNVLFL